MLTYLKVVWVATYPAWLVAGIGIKAGRLVAGGPGAAGIWPGFAARAPNAAPPEGAVFLRLL